MKNSEFRPVWLHWLICLSCLSWLCWLCWLCWLNCLRFSKAVSRRQAPEARLSKAGSRSSWLNWLRLSKQLPEVLEGRYSKPAKKEIPGFIPACVSQAGVSLLLQWLLGADPGTSPGIIFIYLGGSTEAGDQCNWLLAYPRQAGFLCTFPHSHFAPLAVEIKDR